MNILSIKRKILDFSRFSGNYLKPLIESKKLKIFHSKNSHIFFGYYDKSPFNITNEYLLAGQLPIKDQFFDNNTPLTLGFYNLFTEDFNIIDRTKAWCWQQGARLFWHPIEKNIVTYNKLVNNKYKNIFFDIEKNNIVHIVDCSIYDLSHNAEFSISLNFERLQLLRPGYGYEDKGNAGIDIKHSFNDGIIKTNIQSNKSELIIPLSKVCKINPTDQMKDSWHYFNHVSISPKSTGFIFLHLWDNKIVRSSRLFYYNISTNKLTQLTENPVSHYSWKNDNEILVTEEANARCFYNIYNINSGEYKTISKELLFEDGHPSILKDEKSFIYDNYRDKIGYQSLKLFDMKKQKSKTLLKTYIPNKYIGENKCDLHPRINKDNSLISLDLVHKGKRAMGLYRLE